MTSTYTTTFTNAQMVTNIPNIFGVYMSSGRFFTHEKVYIGGFIQNYYSDYNLRFGIVHTWDWHDYFNPPDLTSFEID